MDIPSTHSELYKDCAESAPYFVASLFAYNIIKGYEGISLEQTLMTNNLEKSQGIRDLCYRIYPHHQPHEIPILNFYGETINGVVQKINYNRSISMDGARDLTNYTLSPVNSYSFQMVPISHVPEPFPNAPLFIQDKVRRFPAHYFKKINQN